MTAVTSHQCLPELIDSMPKGEAKDMVLRLCGQSGMRLFRYHITMLRLFLLNSLPPFCRCHCFWSMGTFGWLEKPCQQKNQA